MPPAVAAASVGSSPDRIADGQHPPPGADALPDAPVPPCDPAAATLLPRDAANATVDAPPRGAETAAGRGPFDSLAPAGTPGAPGRLGGYHILKELGRGGMGVLKVHLEPAKVVAVKPVEAPIVEATNADRRAAEWVLKVGGALWVVPPDGVKTEVKTVDFLPISEKCPVVAINLDYNAKADDAGLENLKGLTSLEDLSLGVTGVTDAGVRRLEGLKSLRKLNLAQTSVTSAAAASIGRLKRLQELGLFQTAIGDDALVHLATLPDLRAISLQRTQITDAGLKHLSRMTSLRRLYLGDRPLSDDGLAALGGLTGLEELRLNGTDLIGTGLRRLESMANLRILDLVACGRLTDEGLASLPEWPKLETLELTGARGITGEGVKSLARFKHLRRLVLAETPTSAEDARLLRAVLPECEILPGSLELANPLEKYAGGKWTRYFTSDKDIKDLPPYCHLKQGVLEVTGSDGNDVELPSAARNFIMRAKIKADGALCGTFLIRANKRGNFYAVGVDPAGVLFGGKTANGHFNMLGMTHFPPFGKNFVDLACIVEGNRITAFVSSPPGFLKLEMVNDDMPEGGTSLRASKGTVQFKDVEIQVLDEPKPEPPPAGTPK